MEIIFHAYFFRCNLIFDFHNLKMLIFYFYFSYKVKLIKIYIHFFEVKKVENIHAIFDFVENFIFYDQIVLTIYFSFLKKLFNFCMACFILHFHNFFPIFYIE